MNRDFVALAPTSAHDRRRDERRGISIFGFRPAAWARPAAAVAVAAGLLAGCGGGGDTVTGFLFGEAPKAQATATVPAEKRDAPQRVAPQQTAPQQTAQAVPASTDPEKKPAAVVDIPPAKDKKRQTAAKTPDYPACKTVRKPQMITFDRSVHPGQLVTVAAVGDVLLHDSVQKYAGRKKQGFYSLMKPVADLIRAADVAFANLEGPAAANINKRGRAVRPPKGLWDKNVYSGYPMFNYHPSIVADLKQVGFDVLLTANNHAMDRYAIGADKTIEALRAAGMPYTGTKHRGEMDRPWYATTKVVKDGAAYTIAWLGCTYSTNGIPDKAKQVLHCYSQRDTVLSTIRSLAARSDIQAVILTPHWGLEYHHKPDQKQQSLAHDALDAGATAVIGTHPHVIQPIEKYRTKDGRETLIAYSLGNFVSNQIGLPRRSSAILLMGLSPDARGKLSVASVGWIPIWMRKRGGIMQVEAIDRANGHAKRNLAHLVKHLPEENEAPARTAFWAGRACTRLAQR